MHSRSLHAMVSAAAFPSLLVGLDVVSSVICVRVPLYWYLAATALGILVGFRLQRRASGKAWFSPYARWLVVIVAAAGLLGAVWMTVSEPSWNSHCASRYCDRVLGPSFSRSPFPVGTPSCAALAMCANENPFSDDDEAQLLTLMRAQGCAPP